MHPQQFADDTKLGGGAGTPEGGAVIQSVLSSLVKWVNKNLTEFSTGKCKVLHLKRNHLIKQSV